MPAELSSLLRGPWRWPFRVAVAALLLWALLGIGYAPWGAAPLRWTMAAAFLVFSAWAIWRARPAWCAWLAVALAIAAIGMRWAIQPSLDRDWQPEVAVMPRVEIDHDLARIANVRNFRYRSTHDFDVRYETREVRLSDMRSVDFFISYWWPGPVAHTFVSFTFDHAAPVSVSIETRPEKGEGFDPLASMFRRFELIYVVGDERDIVGVRTNHRHEDVYLYHTNASPAAARRLFLEYAQRINALAERPEFYNLLSNSCTINIVRYANRAGRTGSLDYRHVLNGYSDRYLYSTGLINTEMPFAELRAMSHVNSNAQAADGAPDFPAAIRRGLPPAN